MYFDSLPKMMHTLGGEVEAGKLMTNLLTVVGRRVDVASDKLLFERVIVRDGESPELVADKYYGHVKWWWVVCLTAGVKSRDDWPASVGTMNRLVDRLTTETAISHLERDGVPASRGTRRVFEADGVEIRHHEDGGGLGVERFGRIVGRATPVLESDRMTAENESRRRISILHKDHLSDFYAEFKSLVGRA